jgi:hypothetical protein
VASCGAGLPCNGKSIGASTQRGCYSGADVALRCPVADDHQHDSADQTNPAQDGRKRDGLLLFRSRLNGAEIEHLLALGIRDPAVRQRDDADNDKNDADDSGWLHRFDVIKPGVLRSAG